MKLSFFVLTALLAMPAAAAAQATPGCYANFNLMPSAKIDGADVHVGDIYHLANNGQNTSIGTNLSDEVATDSLDVKMAAKFFVTAEGGCVSKGGLGFEVSGFTYNTSGSLSGTVTQGPSSNSNFTQSGLNWWDRHIPVAVDKFAPYGISPIPYQASASLKLQEFEFGGLYNFINSNQAIGGVFAHVSFLRVDSTRSEGEQQTGFLPDHYTVNGISDTLAFSSQSELKSTMWGPSVGARFTGIIGDPNKFSLELDGRLEFGWLRGGMDETGNWTAHEVGSLGLVANGNLTVAQQLFTADTSVPLSRSENGSVRMTNLMAGLGFRLFHGCLVVGPSVGKFELSGLPLAAAFSAPTSAPFAAATWKRQSGNTTISDWGFLTSVKFSF